jgi:hypothetical protein
VHIVSPDTRQWWELQAHDGFYIPEGIPHRVTNDAGQPASILFGIAPSYFQDLERIRKPSFADPA